MDVTERKGSFRRHHSSIGRLSIGMGRGSIHGSAKTAPEPKKKATDDDYVVTDELPEGYDEDTPLNLPLKQAVKECTKACEQVLACAAHMHDNEIQRILSTVCNCFFMQTAAEICAALPTYTCDRVQPRGHRAWVELLFEIVQGGTVGCAMNEALEEYKLELMPQPDLKEIVDVVPALQNFQTYLEKVCLMEGKLGRHVKGLKHALTMQLESKPLQASLKFKGSAWFEGIMACCVRLLDDTRERLIELSSANIFADGKKNKIDGKVRGAAVERVRVECVR